MSSSAQQGSSNAAVAVQMPEDGRIVRLLVPNFAEIKKSQHLLIYEIAYQAMAKVESEDGRVVEKQVKRTERKDFLSPCDGSLSRWAVKEGDARSKGQKLASIKKPCSHPVNFGGLCGVCGKDLTTSDSTGARHDSRVNILISHENTNLMVSQKEAERIEMETAKRLLGERKLSLILDLDQTVIHATIHPQIDYWLQNPQMKDHPSLKDVYRFHLPDNPAVYFVKLRPGLREFLKIVKELFELHIYTMGTRNYAAKISRIIDPKNELFKERVLSRDESGSFTQKTIKRLFPCDDSMVLVLDDRADVWQWSENLIKVRPYHFFVGTGDINAPPNSRRPPNSDGGVSSRNNDDDDEDNNNNNNNNNSNGGSISSTPAEEMGTEQLPPPPVEEVPFTENHLTSTAPIPDNIDSADYGHQSTLSQLNPPFLLDDADKELIKLTEILHGVHRDFYSRQERVSSATSITVNVKDVLMQRKRQVLAGTRVAFSGLVPIGHELERSEVWMLAESFGAQCCKQIDGQLTHLIAAKWGTTKVHDAHRMFPGVRIVRPAWLYDSISLWQRQAEELYYHKDQEAATEESLPDRLEGIDTSTVGARQSLDINQGLQASDSSAAGLFTLNSDLSYRTLDRAEINALNQELYDELGDVVSDEEESSVSFKHALLEREYAGNDGEIAGSEKEDEPPRKIGRVDSGRRRYEPRRKSPLAKAIVSGTLSLITSSSSDVSEAEMTDDSLRPRSSKRRPVKSLSSKKKQRHSAYSDDESTSDRRKSDRDGSDDDDDDDNFSDLARQIEAAID